MRIRNTNSSFKYRYGLLSVLAVFMLNFLMLACTRDVWDDEVPVSPNEALVRLTLTTPGTSFPKTLKSDNVDTEHLLSDIKILVFTDAGSGNYRFKYMVDGQNISSDSEQKTTFSARLKSSDEPVKLLLAANCASALSAITLPVNTPEQDVRESIILSVSTDYTNGIPMFGEKIVDQLDATKVNTFSLTLLRAIARVDVEVDLDTGNSKGFIMESVRIYRANGMVQVVPNISAMANTANPKVAAPSVPAGAQTVAPYIKNVVSLGDKKIERVYLPESVDYNAANEYNKVTCVVVGGYFNGETTATYYRADFNSGLGGHPFGQVLRNHLYHFKIKRVNGSGWETPDEAAHNRATLITVDIQTWEDFTIEMYDNGENYFGIDSRDVVFNYQQGLEKTVGVQATVPYKISWVGENESTESGGTPVRNEYFSAQIVNKSGDPDDVSYIKLVTLSQNNTNYNREAMLKVEWGRWELYVNITQQRYTTAGLRPVRLLTSNIATGAIGNMNGVGQDGVMRAILANSQNFSPNGKINYLTGFAFEQFGTTAYFGAAEGTAQADLLVTQVYASDVIYLNNENELSAYGAKVVMDWLESSDNRVLIVGGDAATTSPYLLRGDLNGYLSGDVDWWYNNSYKSSWNHDEIQTAATGSFSYYDINDDNREFYDGPFGTVDLTALYGCADKYFGYAKQISADVIPLMYHTNTVNNKYMVFGVNKKKRVFYHGDASAFQQGAYRLSGNATVTSNQDIFWANVWAWVTKQVIYGYDEP